MAGQRDAPIKIPPDNRATYMECGLLSREQYRYKFKCSFLRKKCLIPKIDTTPEIFENGWIAEKVVFDPKVEFLATIYSNDERQQVVVAYRGTDTFQALIQGYKEIWCNKINGQKMSSYLLIDKAIQITRKNKWENARITFTGHSLGGFLAITSLFFAEDNQNEEYKSITFNAVAFESPGEAESLKKLQPTQQEFQINLSKLDVISFLSYPNAINTINSHIGTIIMMDIRIPGHSPNLIEYLKQCHSMEAIVEWLEKWEEEKNERKKERGSDGLKPKIMISWPKLQISGNFFATHAHTSDGRYEIDETKVDQAAKFCLEYKDKLKALESKYNPRQQLPLRNFNKKLQEFLLHCNREILPDDNRRLRDFKVEKLGENIPFVIHGISENSGDIWQFRADISVWLSKETNIQKYLINSNAIPTTSAPVNNSTFIRGSTKITGNTKFNNNTVSANSISIQEGVDLTYATAALQHLLTNNGNDQLSFIDSAHLEIDDTVELNRNKVTRNNVDIYK